MLTSFDAIPDVAAGAFVQVCAWCFGQDAQRILKMRGVHVSHGVCPACREHCEKQMKVSKFKFQHAT